MFQLNISGLGLCHNGKRSLWYSGFRSFPVKHPVLSGFGSLSIFLLIAFAVNVCFPKKSQKPFLFFPLTVNIQSGAARIQSSLPESIRCPNRAACTLRMFKPRLGSMHVSNRTHRFGSLVNYPGHRRLERHFEAVGWS